MNFRERSDSVVVIERRKERYQRRSVFIRRRRKDYSLLSRVDKYIIHGLRRHNIDMHDPLNFM